MNYLSVCAGIEAATVAWHPLGWTPVAFSEIEPFPSAVLAHHYPNTPNWGDMERFHEWPDADVDLLVGGTPCQSFSVAGLRKGMDDPRGNLALVYLAIAAKYRPEWLVWENVPGVLSSDGGRALGAFLGGLSKLGYGFAYRVLDAQYFGVAQRRRRVFVVANARDWRSAAAVLFEPESLRGDSPPRREAGEGVAGGSASGVALRGREGGGTAELTGGVATALRASQGGGDKPHVLDGVPDIAATVTAGVTNGGAGHGARSGHAKDSTLIPTTAHALTGEGFDASEDGTGRGTPLVPETANPLTARMAKGINTTADEGQTPIPCAFHNRQDPDVSGEVTHPLGAKDNGQAVAFKESQSGVREGWPHAILDANKGARRMEGVREGMSVRRLTPRECERLQGFPDGYTAITYRGKPAADGPRYKALGNSMA
ncbi:MAG: DNA cytosine methyltransferase, partial [Salinirussus sp.]